MVFQYIKQLRVTPKRLTLVLAGMALLTLSACYAKSGKEANPNEVTLTKPHGKLVGTLLKTNTPSPLVIMISGSGPTDRNGNQPLMRNDSLKMLAESLYQAGISSLRYDKRGIGDSKFDNFKESDVRFQDFIQDARDWITQYQKDSHFSDIFVLGHSEGSLIGMVAARETQTQGFISLAGAGYPADEVLKKQLQEKAPKLAAQARPIIDQLKTQEKAEKVPLMLKSLFRESVQPYMHSWFQFDPRQEVAQLSQPVLIVQGNTDIQVSKADAEALANAQPNAKLVIIDGMNHVLKSAPIEQKANLKTYRDPKLALHEAIMPALVTFIQSHT